MKTSEITPSCLECISTELFAQIDQHNYADSIVQALFDSKALFS